MTQSTPRPIAEIPAAAIVKDRHEMPKGTHENPTGTTTDKVMGISATTILYRDLSRVHTLTKYFPTGITPSRAVSSDRAKWDTTLK